MSVDSIALEACEMSIHDDLHEIPIRPSPAMNQSKVFCDGLGGPTPTQLSYHEVTADNKPKHEILDIIIYPRPVNPQCNGQTDETN